MNSSSTEAPSLNPIFFQTTDYVLFGVFAFVPLAFGIYFTFFVKKENTTSEYFVGSRNVNGLLITISILATFASSITYIGLPTEVYMYGSDWWYILIGFVLGMPFVAHSMVPVIYKLGCTSVFEYIEKRFNRAIRIVVSLTFTVYILIRLAFVIYGPGLALSQITGIHVWVAILVITISAVIYTFLGGIKAVMWLDALQLILMFVAILSSNIKGIIDVGGFTSVMNITIEGERIHPVSFSFDPTIRYTFWGLILYGWLLCVTSFGLAHHQVQRYVSASSLNTAQKSAWANLPGLIIVYSLCSACGLIIYAKYASCDPLTSKRISASDQIVSLFIADTFEKYPGMLGVFGSGLFCGSIGASSSFMNTISAIIVEGYLKRIKRIQALDEGKITLISRILIVIIGIMALLLVMVAEMLGNIHKSFFAFFSFFSGIVTGVFLLGLFCPWVSSLGAGIGIFCTYIIGGWITVGIQLNKNLKDLLPISVEGCENSLFGNVTKKHDLAEVVTQSTSSIYNISYLWALPICTSIILVVGGISSFITNRLNKNKGETDRLLISPWINYLSNNIINRNKRKNTSMDEDNIEMETREPMLNSDKEKQIDGVNSPD